MLSDRWSVLALLFAVRTGMGVQYQAVAALSPFLMADLSLGFADIGMLIGLYHAPGMVLAFAGGAIGARLGDKRVALMGLALMIAGGLATALGSGWPIQIGSRLLAGIGGILLNVSMSKMVVDWFAGREVATAMAIFGDAAPFGIALALVTLPSVAAASGLVWALAAVVAYLIVAACALAFLYRAAPSALPATGAVSHWPDRRISAAVLRAGVIYGLYNASLVAILGFGPLLLIERGSTVGAAASSTSIVLWLVAISLPFGGFLADRVGRSATVLVASMIAFAGALLLASRVDAVLPAFVLLGIVAGLPGGPVMSLPAAVLEPRTRSIGMGLFFSVYYFLQIAGPWLLGYCAKLTGSPQAALDLGAVFLLVGVVLFAASPSLRPAARSRATHDPVPRAAEPAEAARRRMAPRLERRRTE